MMDVDPPQTQPVAAQYTEHVNPQGRKYWYDTVNKTSHWEKPAVLQTAFERAMVSTPWKEYTSKGRPYWVHKETKQSVWDLPEELVQLKKEHGQPDEEVKPFFPPLAAPSPVIPTGLRASMSPSKAIANSPLPGVAPATPLGHPNPEAQTSTSGHALALIPQSMIDSLPAIPVGSSTPHDVPPPTQVNHAPHFDAPRDRFVIPEGGWRTVEQAEEAFEYLLQKAGVQESWAWDVAMRATITDPLYKSLQTLAEKKAVFNKYIAHLKATHALERDARLNRLRPQFKRLLQDHPQIHTYSTFKTADAMFQGNSIWESAKGEERTLLWEGFLRDLKAKEEADETALRKRNLDVLSSIFNSVSLTPQTRYPQFLSSLHAQPAFQNDPLLARLDSIEIVILYESRMKVVEQAYEEQRAKERLQQRRAARHAREAFKMLLETHLDAGRITWRSKWQGCLPLWKSDDIYLALLGKSGSSPLDLFHDLVDDLTGAIEGKAKSVEGLLEEVGFAVKLETERSQFDDALASIKFQGSETDKNDLWEVMHGRLVARAAEEERRREKKKRYAIEDFRYAMRKVDPPLSLEASYEEVEEQLKKIKEYSLVEVPEDRKGAWEKFVKRQKEKLREEERASSSRDHARHSSRTDRDREFSDGRGGLPYSDQPNKSRKTDKADETDMRESRIKEEGAKRGGSEREDDDRATKRAKKEQEDLEEGEI